MMPTNLVGRIAEELAVPVSGRASDGRGWFRTDAQRDECFQLAKAVAELLTTDTVVDNAADAVRAHPWTCRDVADVSDRDLRIIVRIVLRSIGGA